MSLNSPEVLQVEEKSLSKIKLFTIKEPIDNENSNSVDLAFKQQLISDFKQQPIFDIIAGMSAAERTKLFEKPDTDASTENETPYFQTNLLSRVRQRAVWLIVLLIANTATTAVIRNQESVLQQMIILAAFIPLLIGTAGNVSTQSATVVIRGLSRGTVEQKQALRRIVEEAIAGILIGLILSIFAIAIVLLLKGSLAVAMVVAISLMLASAFATISGATLPFLFKACGFDPAIMSAPLSSVIVDVTGVLIFMNVALFLLGLQPH
jgi:magnesium transporter